MGKTRINENTRKPRVGRSRGSAFRTKGLQQLGKQSKVSRRNKNATQANPSISPLEKLVISEVERHNAIGVKLQASCNKPGVFCEIADEGKGEKIYVGSLVLCSEHIWILRNRYFGYLWDLHHCPFDKRHLLHTATPDELNLFRRESVIEHLTDHPELLEMYHKKVIHWALDGVLDSNGVPCRGNLFSASHVIRSGEVQTMVVNTTFHESVLSGATPGTISNITYGEIRPKGVQLLE